MTSIKTYKFIKATTCLALHIDIIIFNLNDTFHKMSQYSDHNSRTFKIKQLGLPLKSVLFSMSCPLEHLGLNDLNLKPVILQWYLSHSLPKSSVLTKIRIVSDRYWKVHFWFLKMQYLPCYSVKFELCNIVIVLGRVCIMPYWKFGFWFG